MINDHVYLELYLAVRQYHFYLMQTVSGALCKNCLTFNDRMIHFY